MLGGQRPPEALAGYTGFLLNWCAQRTRSWFAERLREQQGLHAREFGLLSVVQAHPDATQLELGEATGIDPSTMVQTIDALQARGLAERLPHPTDRRKRIVRLTPQGDAALRDGQRLAAGAAEELFGRLDEDERAELHRILRKLAGFDDDEAAAAR
jgi:MarR family transcriptional regulator, lower aerobic nicotinate degradation pathway regulator